MSVCFYFGYYEYQWSICSSACRLDASFLRKIRSRAKFEIRDSRLETWNKSVEVARAKCASDNLEVSVQESVTFENMECASRRRRAIVAWRRVKRSYESQSTRLTIPPRNKMTIALFNPWTARAHREKFARAGNLLAFWSKPTVGRGTFSGMSSSSTQQLHIKPPEQRSTGRPPPKTQLMLRPHSNLAPLYLQVCGITETTDFACDKRRYIVISVPPRCVVDLLISTRRGIYCVSKWKLL